MIPKRLLDDANELCRLGVAELSAGFSAGKFTPLEVAQATLARAAQVQERLNAFSLIDAEAALTMATESTARCMAIAEAAPRATAGRFLTRPSMFVRTCLLDMRWTPSGRFLLTY
jgi:hypothetical protein